MEREIRMQDGVPLMNLILKPAEDTGGKVS
jgi:hypothetical protein